MCDNAKVFDDFQSEVTKDVYNECRFARHKIAKIIEARSFNNKLDGMEELLSALDYMDKKILKF